MRHTLSIPSIPNIIAMYSSEIFLSIYQTGVPGSSVGITTDYELDGPGSNYYQGLRDKTKYNNR